MMPSNAQPIAPSFQFLKLFILTVFISVVGIITLFITINLKTEEIFVCEKSRDICTYQYKTFIGKKPISQKVLSLSNILTLREKVNREKHGGREDEQTIITYHIYFYLSNNHIVEYPIEIKSQYMLKEKYDGFRHFLANKEQPLFVDTKTTDVKKILIVEFIIFIIFIFFCFSKGVSRQKRKTELTPAQPFKNKQPPIVVRR